METLFYAVCKMRRGLLDCTGTPRRLNIFMRRETNSAAAAAAGRAAAELI